MMTQYKMVILEVAVSELENAIIYYNNQVSGLGFDFEDEVFRMFELIQNNPLLFPVKFAHFREAVVWRFPFVICYEVLENKIVVSAIFHTRQSPLKKTRRKNR